MDTKLKQDFDKGNGLLPAIIQDVDTHKVLMLGFMNKAAFIKTLETGKVCFFSRTKQRLWTKGEESGNFLYFQSIKMDCDNDTFLIQVKPAGPVCHLNTDTCWGEVNEADKILFLGHLQRVIQDRKDNPSNASYTASLFKKGINKIAQKVGEEAVELVIEAKDDNDEFFLGEAADLLYHYMILLVAKGKSLEDVMEVLVRRHQ